MLTIPKRFSVNPIIKGLREAGGSALAKSGIGLENLFGRYIHLNPETAMKMSTSPAVRWFAENVGRGDAALAKNFEGKASSQGIETILGRERDTTLGIADERTQSLYGQYRERMSKSGQKPLTELAFREEAGKTIRRNAPHSIPEVNELAKTYKEGIYNPYLKRQVDNGMISDKVAANEDWVSSYENQQHNINAIMNNPDKHIGLVAQIFDRDRVRYMGDAKERIKVINERGEKLKSEYDKRAQKIQKIIDSRKDVITEGEDLMLTRAEKRLEKLNKQYEQKQGKIQSRLEAQKKKIDDLKNMDVMQEALNYKNNIMNAPYGMTPLAKDLSGSSRFAKTRRLIIPKDLLPAYEEFLINDIRENAHAYVHNVLPRMLFKERFKATPKEILQQASKSYDELILTEGLSPKEKYQLAKEKRRMEIYINATIDRLFGRYKLPENPYGIVHRISRAVLKLNTLRSLGNVMPASLPDIARNVSRFGLGRVIRVMSGVLSDKDFASMAAKDMKKTIGIYELLLNERINNWAEISKGYQPISKAEQGLEYLSNKFGKFSLLSPWDQIGRQFSSLSAANFILETSEKVIRGQELTTREIARMAENGIEIDDMIDIFNEFSKNGEVSNSVYIPQTDKWQNRRIADMFNNAVRRESDLVRANPGLLARPLWASTETGRHVFQFRSFGFTITQAGLLSGLQYRDIATANGMMLSIFLGSIIYVLSEKLKGKEVNYDGNNLFIQGLDRSGLFGWMMDANNVIERMSRGSYGINPLLGGPGMSRYRALDGYHMLGGPSVGTVADLWKVSGSILGKDQEDPETGNIQNDWTKDDVRALRRLIPYQSLFYIRWLFDGLEEGYARAVGVDESDNR